MKAIFLNSITLLICITQARGNFLYIVIFIKIHPPPPPHTHKATGKKINYINRQLGLWWGGIKGMIPNHLATTKIRGLPIAGAGVLFQHTPDKIQNGVLLLDISLKRIVMMKWRFTVVVWGSEYLNLKERYTHVHKYTDNMIVVGGSKRGITGLQSNPCWVKELSL